MAISPTAWRDYTLMHHEGPHHESVNLFFCVEEVHPGSDRTSHSAARNQVPSHKSDFKSEKFVGCIH